MSKKKLKQTRLFEDVPIKMPNKKNRIKYLLIIGFIIVAIIFTIILLNRKEAAERNSVTIEIPNNNSLPLIADTEINIVSKFGESFDISKPSFIVFAGTYCPHCRTLVPELKTEIWDNYNTKANIWIQVTDGKTGKTFDVTEIAQGYNPSISYDEIMGDCGYVPAYVVLDKDGQEILRSCGGTKTIDEVKAALDSQLN